jgi:uncharacterized membrane protein YwaF
MFTGIDIVVILLVLLVFFYTNAPETRAEIKMEPFALILIMIMVGAIVMSFA